MLVLVLLLLLLLPLLLLLLLLLQAISITHRGFGWPEVRADLTYMM